MTPVPDHWVPFVAVPGPAPPAGTSSWSDARCCTSATTAPPTSPTRSACSARRRRVATDRLRLAEEEVPRDGAVVTRRYQLARTPDGGTALWIGRRKRVGEGEGWSGLRFDTALAPGAIDR